MREVVLLRSQLLLEKEGTVGDRGYKYSTHREDLDRLDKALGDVNVLHVIWDENRLLSVVPSERKPGVIVVPAMRVCSELTFQKLKLFAESGWIVFAGIDSFYYRTDDRISVRVQEPRIRELFGLPANSEVHSKRLRNGQLHFSQTEFSWLTRELPSPLNLKGNIQPVLNYGKSTKVEVHGEIRAGQVESLDDGKVEQAFSDKVYPAFLVCKNGLSGGAFIYACFPFLKVENYKQVLANLAKALEVSPPTDTVALTSETRILRKQIQALKFVLVTIVFVASLVFGQLLVGSTATSVLGSAIIGIVLGIAIALLTDLTRWFMKQ